MTKHNIPKTIRYNEGILRGMFTALSAYIKTETWEIQINNLIMQLKALENKPLPLDKVDRNRESKSELNLIKLKQTNNTKNQWNKVLVFFFEKINRIYFSKGVSSQLRHKNTTWLCSGIGMKVSLGRGSNI